MPASPRRPPARAAACALLGVALAAEAAFAASSQVLMTEEEAIARALGPVDRVVRREFPLDADARARISAAAGAPVFDERLVFVEGTRGSDVVGWVYLGSEKGLYEPITFAVGIAPDGTVIDVEILIYRESRGGEVARRRFLNQYRGKGPRSALRINKDILNITGATVSSRSVTIGVRKAVAAFQSLGVAGAAGPESSAAPPAD